jgi:hypothetical protein
MSLCETLHGRPAMAGVGAHWRGEGGGEGAPLGGGIGAARGRHGEGLLGVAPCSWLLCGPSAS